MTDAPWNSYLSNSIVYKTNQLSETLPFDLKISHLLDMLKNRLQNWHYPKCACQICSKFFFLLSFFYNAINKFRRSVNKYCYYRSYQKKHWMYSTLISLGQDFTLFLWNFSIKIFDIVKFALEGLTGLFKREISKNFLGLIPY